VESPKIALSADTVEMSKMITPNTAASAQIDIRLGQSLTGRDTMVSFGVIVEPLAMLRIPRRKI